jgi:chromosome segregation ATPase
MGNELQALARTIAELQDKNGNLKEILDSKSDMLRQLLAEREVWEMNEKELKQEVEKLKRECDGLKGCNKAQAKDITAEYELRQKAERALEELQELYTKCADDRRNARNAFAGVYRFIRMQGLLTEYNEFAGVNDEPAEESEVA